MNETRVFAILDTNIYINHWERNRYHDELALCRQKYIIRQSAVVLHELRRYAIKEQAIKLVEQLRTISPVIYTPNENHWWRSAIIVQEIAADQKWNKNKIREFQNDVLIALAALSNGATIITDNKKDFELIKSRLNFRLEIW